MKLRVAAVMLAAALLVAACDSNDRPSLDRDGDGVAPPRKGGILRLGISQLPAQGLDPAQARTPEQLLVVDQLYDTLTRYDPKTMEPKAGLAERWVVTPDQKQWDFTLRAGAAFANGRPIAAADVKFSFERLVRKGSASPNADLLESVAGYFAFAVEGGATELAGVSTPAPDVVRISTDQPFSELPSLLANPALGIVPRESAEGIGDAGFTNAPIGSGPFTFRQREGNTISLVRAPGSPALVDGVELVQFDDVAAAYAAFKRREVEWSRVPPADVAEAADRFGQGAFRPYVAELFYAFNLANPKFADVRFREAIVRAIDRRAIIRAIYDDTVRAIDGLVVDGVPGHQEEPCGEKCEHSPARARALLQEAFPGATPPEVFVDFDQDEVQEKVANAIKANLADVGITATLRPRGLQDYQNFAVSGQQELFRLGWIGAFPAADAFLTPLFRTGSASNLARYSSPAVDEKLAAARTEADAGKRGALYQEAERAIMQDVPVVPIAQFQIHAVKAAKVRDLQPLPTGSFDASRVWMATR